MTAPLLTYQGRRASADVVRVNLETLFETRMLVQGSSGAGKTQALFQLLEETHGRVQQLVVDREGQFPKLREQFDYLLIGPGGEVPIDMRKGAIELLLRRVLELQVSAIWDLSDLVPAQAQHYVARLATEMAHLPQRSGLWEHMRLALFDECQWWAPQNGKAESLEPLIELASLGRKRGFCPIAAGTRVAMIAKSFTELLENKLIGRSGTNDAKRAAEELEFDKHGRKELRSLPVGHFYAYGPAIALDPVLVHTPAELPVLPRKRGEHQPPAPATPAKVAKVMARFEGLAEEAQQRARTTEELEQQLAQAKRQIHQLQKGTPTIDPAVIARERAAAAEKATHDALRAQVPTLTKLRRALEAAMKFIVTVSTQSFDVAGVDKAELEQAINAALGRATQLIDQRLAARERQVEKLREDARKLLATLKAVADEQEVAISVNVEKNEPFTLRTPVPAKVVHISRAASADPLRRLEREAGGVALEGDPTPMQREILEVLRSFERIGVEAVPRPNLAAFVGYSASTKSFKNAMSAMRTAGWIDYSGDGVALTEPGRALAGDGGPELLTLEALHQAWKDRLTPADWKLLAPVLDDRLAGGRGIPREQLAESVGYATSTKSFKNGLSRLRTLGAIDYDGGAIVATDMLFPEALR